VGAGPLGRFRPPRWPMWEIMVMRRSPVPLGLFLVLLILPALRAQPSSQGIWGTPFPHDCSGGDQYWQAPYLYCAANSPNFNAIHMSVIPKGPDRGKVLVWDLSNIPTNPPNGTPPSAWIQRWSIIDPETQSFQNFSLSIPGDKGDLFCAGHAWTPDGELFVAGGTRYILYPGPPPVYAGAKIAIIYDPDNRSWRVQPDMDKVRWYPTVTLLGEDTPNSRMIVSGGFNQWPHDRQNPHQSDTAINTYEAFYAPTAGNQGSWDSIPLPFRYWFKGPRYTSNPSNPNADHPLDEYPRMFLLSDQVYGGPTSRLFMAGLFTKSASVDHLNAPEVWDGPGEQIPSGFKQYGSAVLFPGVPDTVMHIGGAPNGDENAPLNLVQTINMRLANPTWTTTGPHLKRARSRCNAVLLPDATVLVVGGNGGLNCLPPPGQSFCPELRPELYHGGNWHLMSPQGSPRFYHSTAVLLPNGKVLSGGGDTRTHDYEVFTPHYLDQATNPVPPQWLTWPTGAMDYGLEYQVDYEELPIGVDVEKVVLVAPCSTTHHSDMHQRYVELDIVRRGGGPGTFFPPWIVFLTPANPTYAPRGYYMIFLITNAKIPSVAQWVKLE